MRDSHRLDLIQRQFPAVVETPAGWWDAWFDGSDYLYFKARERATKRQFDFRLDLRDFNVQPPELTVVSPQTLDPVNEPDAWPETIRFREPHPVLRRPWACLRGLREYHTHISHQHAPWDNYREPYTLHRIMENIVSSLHRVSPEPHRARPERPPRIGRHSWRRAR